MPNKSLDTLVFNGTNVEYANLTRMVALMTGIDRVVAEAVAANMLHALNYLDDHEGIPH